MVTKIGINGFGRIGRLTYRTIKQRHAGEPEVVVINDLADVNANTHTLNNRTNVKPVSLAAKPSMFRCSSEMFADPFNTIRMLVAKNVHERFIYPLDKWSGLFPVSDYGFKPPCFAFCQRRRTSQLDHQGSVRTDQGHFEVPPFGQQQSSTKPPLDDKALPKFDARVVYRLVDSVTNVGYCFVIMPFSNRFNGVYSVTKKVVESRGLYCCRADEVFSHEVMGKIQGLISHATVVIADVSEPNGNVFVEVGMAEALSKRSILLWAQGGYEIPSDLRYRQYITYENFINGERDLEQRLGVALDQLMERSVS